MKIKNPFKRKKEPRNQYAISLNDGTEVALLGINNKTTVKHRDNQLTNLIMARIVRYRQNDTIYFNDCDYIAFELPQNQMLDESIAQTVMMNYLQEKYNNYINKYEERQDTYYIGRLMQYENGYRFSYKSDAVNKAVEEFVKRDKYEQQQRLEEQIQRREYEDRAREYRKSLNANNYEKEMQETRERRIENPELKPISKYERNNKIYYDYDGININTGDILRIRNVDKIGKMIFQNGEQTYLYSAFLNNTPNEDDVELLNDNGMQNGYSVCFELPNRLEDMIINNNKEQILEILKLLSDYKNFENSNELKYIGKINADGRATITEMSETQEINKKVQNMKEEFRRIMQIQKTGDGSR